MKIKLHLLILSLCLVVCNTLGTSIGSKGAAWTSAFQVNPDELANDIRGDILLSDGYGSNPTVMPWPGNKIPYVITGHFSFSDHQLIKKAMEEFHYTTCVRFVPRTDQPIYINITSYGNGCYSSVGYIDTSFDVNLKNPSCIYKGVILHELAHAIGLYHEHIRKDRDSYVRINWENIEENAVYNFEKTSYNLYDQPYNYNSVMHYSAYVFSKNGRPTLEPKGHGNVIVGQRDRLTKGDIRNINHMYKCSPRTVYRKQTSGVQKNHNKRKTNSNGQKVPVAITLNRNDYDIVTLPNGQLLSYPKTNNKIPGISTNRVANLSPGNSNTGFNTGSLGMYTLDTRYPISGYNTQNPYGAQYPSSGYYSRNPYGPQYPSSGYYSQNPYGPQYPNSGYYPQNTYVPTYINPQYYPQNF